MKTIIIKTTMKNMMRTPMMIISNAQCLPEPLPLASLHQDFYHVTSELAD